MDPDLEQTTGAPRKGEVIANKYAVDRVLAQGGMGVVVLARHVQLGQHVALKFLLPDAVKEPGLVQRFIREARASVELQGEHAVKVSDVGTLDSGAPYMVMEYLRGNDLREEIDRGPVTVANAVDYVLQACEAIAEAHARGIIHRDLKPSNLFLTKRPDGSPLVKVLDFGISKILRDAESKAMQQDLTSTSTVLGSPLYMSPEQVRSSKHVDARSDIWALGIVLYELLSGTTPFEAETVPATSAKIVADEPRRIGALRPDLPPELEAAVMRCLEKKPEDRFASVADLVRSLLPCAPDKSRASAERAMRISRDSLSGVEPAAPSQVSPLAPTVATPIHISDSTDPLAPTTARPLASSDPNSPTLAATAGESSTETRTGGSKKPLLLGVAAVVAAVLGTVAIMGRTADEPESPEVVAPEPADTPTTGPPAERPAAAIVKPALELAEVDAGRPGAARASAEPVHEKAKVRSPSKPRTARPRPKPSPSPAAPAEPAPAPVDPMGDRK